MNSIFRSLKLVASLCLLILCSLANAQTLISSNASWKYLDNGSNQGTAWTAISFNDASWSTGSAVHGYGTVTGATVTTTINNNATTYFRKSISLSNPSYSSLALDLLCDDGAVIYINGTQVHAYNMPSTWNYTTYASSAIGGTDEGDYTTYYFSGSALVNGTNVIAVELHNATAGSSDLGFDMELYVASTNALLTRGPYIQNTTDSTAIVRWRTNIPAPSSLQYGTTHGTYNTATDSTAFKTDHEIVVSGLTPNSKYYYYLSTDGNDTISRYDNSYYFRTNPTEGTKTERVGFWVLGDQGQPGTRQDDVHLEALSLYQDSMDLILMLGDNAYSNGTDAQFEAAVFGTQLDSIMRNTPVYSTVGNHEVRYVTAHSISTPETTPYYLIHSFPVTGEGGGVASNTESYFSWNYANVHFVSINAEEEDLDSSTSSMWSWLETDLQQNTMDWIVVIVHQGPYTKGSHNSDTENEHIKVRENFLPLLERYGVDLMMSGHSHSYERSKLVKGHFGLSSTHNTSVHDLDDGFGRLPGSGSLTNDCAYKKTTDGPTAGEGAVYITAGSSSKSGGGTVNHPVMKVNYLTYGSCFVEVYDNKLSLTYIEDDGDIADYFQIYKDTDFDTTHRMLDSTIVLTASWPDGPYLWSTGQTSRSISITPGQDSLVTVQNETGSSPCLLDSFMIDFPQLVRYPFEELDTTGMSYQDSDGSSVIRAYEHTDADINGWHYYFHPGDSNALLFAVRNSLAGGNTLHIDSVVDYIELRKAKLYDRLIQGIDSFHLVLPYDWNVHTKNTPNGNMDIKFYYNPIEISKLTAVSDSIEATNTDLASLRTWFKANQGSGISFLNGDINVLDIDNSLDITALLSNAPNYTNGIASTDSSPWMVEGNGKNFVQFNGLTSFSGGTLSETLFDPTPLPVNWLSFQATLQEKDAHLIWQTSSELSNEFFSIERSVDAKEWLEISRIAGNGNLGNISSYYYVDERVPAVARVYYRIKQVDFNGESSYSEIRVLDLSSTNLIQIYPNPTSDQLHIHVDANGSERLLKSKLYTQDASIISVSNKNVLDLSALRAGTYILEVETSKGFSYYVINKI